MQTIQFEDFWKYLASPEFFGIGAAVLGFVLGLICAVYLVGRRRARVGAYHLKAGKRAEKKAVKLLKKQGFRLLERQPRFTSELQVNGHWQRFEVTPDLLVEKGEDTYVVEVKGRLMGNGIANAGIRRQVLEYLYASGYPCLLVDMADRQIDLIEVPRAD